MRRIPSSACSVTPNRHVSSSLPPRKRPMTPPSLDALINDARSAGMRINTWIDIQQLSDLDEGTGKIAYRAIQEGLTNARRHAEGEPVSVEVTMNPDNGIHIHISNPMKRGLSAPNEREIPSATDGNGLAGLTARVQTAGGTCRYGRRPPCLPSRRGNAVDRLSSR